MIVHNNSQHEGLTPWTTSAAENEVDDAGDQGYSFTEQIVVGIILASLVLVAFLGNLLVIISIFTDPVLKQKKSNRYFVSLAIADILVALLVMSFGLINEVHGKWKFGSRFCLIWVCCDITCSTASILNLCIICVDRYLQIARPMYYGAYVTGTVINTSTVMVWALSVFLAFVPLQLGWHLPPPDQRMPADPNTCILDISFVYAVVSSSISFYIPCIIILCLYLKIFLVTRHHVRSITQQKLSLSIVESSQSLNNVKAILAHLKATITLGVIVGVFLICWLPFFIINPIVADCLTCIPPSMFNVFTWMGWANSSANPVIYPALNKDFRNAFGRKLRQYHIIGTTRTGFSVSREINSINSCNQGLRRQPEKLPQLSSTSTTRHLDSREVLNSRVTFAEADDQ